MNNMIEELVEPCFELKPKINRKSLFNFRSVDPENISLLDISGKNVEFVTPSFKFAKFHNVCALNFSSTRFNDQHMESLANYLLTNPALYSITLDTNTFTDTGFLQIAEAMKTNKVVCHLAFRGCRYLSKKALNPLLEALNDINMVLY